MGPGEKIESGVYGLFLLFGIAVLVAVMISMAGMALEGDCSGAPGANGHSECYNRAWDNTISAIEGR